MNEDSKERLEELAQLRVTPEPGFEARVREAIERRELAAQAVDLSWNGALEVLARMVDLVVGLFSSDDVSEEGEDQ